VGRTAVWKQRQIPTKHIFLALLGLAVIWAAWHFRDFVHPKAWILDVIHMSVLTFLRITGYGLIPIIMAWAGLHLATMAFDNPKERLGWRIAFILLAVFGIGIVTIVEVKVDVEHKAEVEQQNKLSGHLSSQVDTLVDIQTRIASTKPYLIAVDLSTLKQQLRDDQERTRIALDSIERRLSQIGEVHRDNLRTRALQTSRDLLALLYEHPCNVDPKNPNRADVILEQCTKGILEGYVNTYRKPVLQILEEFNGKGLDVNQLKRIADFAERTGQRMAVERLAVELSQLAEGMPKEN